LQVKEFLSTWGYLGIFVGLMLTGVGFPMPEELPVVIGGGMAGHPGSGVHWWLMLPVCIVGVVISDAFLYTIGRFWGPRLLRSAWIQRRLFPPDRLVKIEQNFDQYGIKLLLFARLTPGIRAPVFFTAGLTRLSVAKFLLADGLYAIPGVSLLFFLGYWFADSMIGFVEGPFEKAKGVIALVVVLLVAAYVLYRALRKPAVTGDPKEMPPLVEKVTHTLDMVTSKIMQPKTSQHRVDPCPPTERMPPSVDGKNHTVGHSEPVEKPHPESPTK
jgi:membrane protein DedA with SNARE-associated domain